MNNLQGVGMEGPVAAEDQNNIVKELKQWAANNWCRDNSRKDGSHDLNVNVSSVVDRLYHDRVDKALCDLIGVEEFGGNRQREFQQRKHAIRKVQDELLNTEFLQVQAEKAKLRSGGNPPEIQRRLAKTQGVAKIKAADAKRLKEMGMVLLTLVSWVKENGKMGIELHDYITELEGIKKLCFSDTYWDLSTKMIDEFMLYLFALRDKRFGLGPLVAVPGDPGMELMDTLPESSPTLGITYNCMHLDIAAIASGGKASRVHITKVCKWPQNFIEAGGLPPNFSLKDPRNIPMDDLGILLGHWITRQKELGCSKSLPFTHYMSGGCRILAEIERVIKLVPPRHKDSGPLKFNLDVLLAFDDTPDLGNPGQGDHITSKETEVRLTPMKDPPHTRQSLAEKTNRSKGKENVNSGTALATPAHSVGDQSGADTSVLESHVLNNSIPRRTGTQQSEDTILATQSPAIDVETTRGPPKEESSAAQQSDSSTITHPCGRRYKLSRMGVQGRIAIGNNGENLSQAPSTRHTNIMAMYKKMRAATAVAALNQLQMLRDPP
ncbi:hypothetical protein DXG01_001814 [Tephrocybe rancida]|nr:hypothetical protein DXG01_001814 [Tephrocybe rancida]